MLRSGSRSLPPTGALLALCALAVAASAAGCRDHRRVPPPGENLAITAFTPVAGPELQPVRVTLAGRDFHEQARVSFDGREAQVVQRYSSISVEVLTPPLAAGAVEVTVQNPGGRPVRAPGTFTAVGPRTVRGRAAAGSVQDGLLRLYEVAADGTWADPPLAEGPTDAAGRFALALGTNLNPFLIEARAGRFIEEGSGQTITLAPDRALRLLAPGGATAPVPLAVTPLTTLAADWALALTAAGGELAEHARNADRLVARGVALASVMDPVPADLTAPAATPLDPTAPAVRAGLVLAALSQRAVELGVASFALLDALRADLIADGRFDGLGAGAQPVPLAGGTLPATTTTSDLAASATAFLRGPRNRSGLTAADWATFLAVLAAGPGAMAPPPELLAVKPAQIHQDGGATLTLLGREFTARTTVRVDESAAVVLTRVLDANPQTLTVRAPPGVHGPATVRVFDPERGLGAALPGGLFYFDPARLDDPPVVTVQAPNGGEFFPGGVERSIAWSVRSPRDVVAVRLEYAAPDGRTVLIADGLGVDGPYAWRVPTIDEPELHVRVTATDVAGLVGADESDAPFALDSRPPDPPTATLTAAADTGASAADGITARADLEFAVTTEPFAAVELFGAAGAVAAGIADSGGALTLALPAPLAEGAHAFFARAADRAGNVSPDGPPFMVTVDRSAPAAPTLALAASDDTGASDSDGLTNRARPSFEGAATEAATLTLHRDGAAVAERAVAAGAFSLAPDADPPEGAGAFTAVLTDAAGNVSAASAPVAVIFDFTAPPAPANLVLAPASDSGVSAADRVTNVTTPAFTAAVEPGARFDLRLGGAVAGSVTAASGAAAVTTAALADGAYAVTATATDAAGNTSAAAAAGTLTIDTTAPVASAAAERVPGAQNDRLVLRYHEAMDPATAADPARLAFEQPPGSVRALGGATAAYDAAAFTATFTFDQPPGEELRRGPFLVRLQGPRDLAGNAQTTLVLQGDVAGDFLPPALAVSLPATQTAMPANHAFVVRAGEDLDPASVSFGTTSAAPVFLFESGGPFVNATLTATDARTLVVRPTAPLTQGRIYVLALSDRVTDVAGNALDAPDCASGNVPCSQPAALVVATAAAPEVVPPAVASVAPADGAAGIAVNAAPVVIFTEAIDPTTAGAVTLTGPSGAVSAAPEWDAAFSTLTLRPAGVLAFGASYTLTAGTGVTDLAGLPLPAAVSVRFTTAPSDSFPPRITLLTANEIPLAHNGGGPAGGRLLLPPAGCTLDLRYEDDGGAGIAPATLTVTTTLGPTSDLSAFFVADATGASWTVGADQSFPAGTGTLTATVRDFAGNLSAPATFAFEIAERTDALRPFESTNVWYLDFDRDFQAVSLAAGAGDTVALIAANGPDGAADFVQDLIAHGLAIAGGGPLVGATGQTVNQIARARAIEAIVRRTYAHYGLEAHGTTLIAEADAVNLRLVTAPPAGGVWGAAETQKPYASFPFSQIALGGHVQDGLSGQAWFDHRNAQQDNDALTRTLAPAANVDLGVFLSTDLKFALNGSPASLFRRTFDPLLPVANRGHAPLGSDPADSVILDPAFDYFSATPAQRARWDLVFAALDLYTANAAAVLAHEIGHSLGLVADGAPPAGLFGGDAANFPGSTAKHLLFREGLPDGAVNLMSPAQLLRERVHPQTAFTALERAFLRERLLVR